MISGVLIPPAAIALTVAAPDQQDQMVRERANVFYREGIEYLRAERFTEAIRSLKEAVAIDNRHAMAFYLLGRAHLARQTYEEALAPLLRSREIYIADGGARAQGRDREAQEARS